MTNTKDCSNCKEAQACVPFFLHEDAMMHKDRDNRRMMAICLALCATLIIVVLVNDMIHPISNSTARDELKALIRADQRFLQIPTPEAAEQIANDLYRARGLYVSTEYLLEVWQEAFRE